MPDLRLRFHKDMLVVAPLFTWSLLDSEEDAAASLEFLNILDDELVGETHRRFRLAGAQCAATNTLRANRAALQAHGLESALVDLNRRGVQLAREAGFEHVLAAIELTEPELLSEQLAALLSEDPDALWLVGDNTAGCAGLAAALACIRAQTDVPVIAPLAAAALPALPESEAPDILYSMGKTLKETLLEFSQRAERPAQPLMACPSVGSVGGATRKQQKAKTSLLSDNLIDLALHARMIGVQFIGTAPGSLPVFTGALSAALNGLDAVL